MASTVRPEDFGKDLGLLHELVVTGRQIGVDRGFYAALAHSPELFLQVKAIVESGGMSATRVPVVSKVLFKWMAVTLGPVTLDGVLEGLSKAGVSIGLSARKALSRACNLAPSDVVETLVRVSVADLGFVEGATRAKIFEAAYHNNLFLCQARVGFQLRMQYLKQPVGESLHVAMLPVDVDRGDCRVFSMGNEGPKGYGLWLRCYWDGPGRVYGPDEQWVFCLKT